MRLGRGGGELRRHQCARGAGVAVDLVGLEQVDPAGDHEGDAVLEGRSGGRSRRGSTGAGDDLVDDDARAAGDRRPEVDHELVVLTRLVKGRSTAGVKVVSTPPKRRLLIPSGALIPPAR